MASVDLFCENKGVLQVGGARAGVCPIDRPSMNAYIIMYTQAGRQLSKMRDLSYVKAPQRAPTRLQVAVYLW